MEASARVVESCVVGQNTGYVSAHSVSDMHCANKLQLDFNTKCKGFCKVSNFCGYSC